MSLLRKKSGKNLKFIANIWTEVCYKSSLNPKDSTGAKDFGKRETFSFELPKRLSVTRDAFP